MGLDQYLTSKAEIKNIRWATEKEKEKENRYDRDVIIIFPDESTKKVKEYEVSDIFTAEKNFHIFEITEITATYVVISHFPSESAERPQTEIIPKNKITHVLYTHAYWRKANQVHNWFVTHIQNSTDDCNPYEVTGQQLFDLIQDCLTVLNKKTKESAEKILPTTDGFFFGNTDYNEHYFQQLQDTVKNLIDIDINKKYTYQSSW